MHMTRRVSCGPGAALADPPPKPMVKYKKGAQKAPKVKKNVIQKKPAAPLAHTGTDLSLAAPDLSLAAREPTLLDEQRGPTPTPLVEAVFAESSFDSDHLIRKCSKSWSSVDVVRPVDTHAVDEWVTALLAAAPWLAGAPPCVLNLWSDCAGMGSEVFALKMISSRLPAFQVKVFAACDRDGHALHFMQRNHAPKHLTLDITARHVTSRGQLQIHDVRSDQNVVVPAGMAVYCAGFPCTPWSKRGAGGGFNDPNSGPFWSALASILTMKPTIFVLECVEAMDSRKSTADAEQSDFQAAKLFVETKLGEHYIIIWHRHVQPVANGFPMTRPRFYVTGNRRDVIHGGEGEAKDLAASLAKNIQERMHDPPSFTAFLAVHAHSNRMDWGRLHCLPSLTELSENPRCGCTLDPMRICEVHPCKCSLCKRHGPGTQCAWRRSHLEWIERRLPSGFSPHAEEGKITYVQLLGQCPGATVPSSPRERNMLNLLACLPCIADMNTSLAIIDLSQTIFRSSFRHDGLTPTLATNSRLFSLQLGRELQLGELMTLCGLPQTADFCGQSHTSTRRLLGNCMHISNIGVVLGIALALAMRA